MVTREFNATIPTYFRTSNDGLERLKMFVRYRFPATLINWKTERNPISKETFPQNRVSFVRNRHEK